MNIENYEVLLKEIQDLNKWRDTFTFCGLEDLT